MTYPISAQVSAGDATLASHYNNLRADGLYLGQSSDDAVALGASLERYETRLEIDKLSAAAVRVPASASAPVSLVIDGFLCQAIANVDLAVGEAPAGAAAAFYVFANRADDSTTFTLTVSTSPTETDNQRRIGRFYWDGSAIVKDSVRSELAGFTKDLLYYVDPQVCDGRLTLSTGVPVPDSDVASSASVFFTPFIGNRVSLYVKDYGWRLYTFSELTLDISGLADNVNIDVWLYDNEGTLTLAYTAWSNATLRATALTRQDGVLVKSGALAYRYLGSVRTSGAGVSCDTVLKRRLWNFYNKCLRPFKIKPTIDSYTYAVAAYRQWNADAANQIDFIIGVSQEPVFASVISTAYNAAIGLHAKVGLGLDCTNANNSTLYDIIFGSALNVFGNGHAIYNDLPGIGYHYLSLVEISVSGTTTFFGDYFGGAQSGLTGFILG